MQKVFLLTLLASVVFFGIFLSISFATTSRGNRLANRFLSALIALLTLHVLKHLLYSQGADLISPTFYLFTHTATFLIGPLLYLYARSLFQRWVGIKAILQHSILAMLFPLLILLLFAIREASIDLLFITVLVLFVILAQILHLLIYVLKTSNFLRKTLKASDKINAYGRQLKLKWLKELTSGFAIILVAAFGYYWHMIMQGYYTFNEELDFAFVSVLSIFILLIGVKSFQIPEIYISSTPDAGRANDQLPEHLAAQFQEKIDRYLEDHQPYLNSEIRIDDLAQSLSIKTYLLSQVINQRYNKTFFQLINSCRIEEAKRIMNANSEDSMIGIAMRAGFNSKTAFYRSFKKSTGLSPLQYIDSLASKS